MLISLLLSSLSSIRNVWIATRSLILKIELDVSLKVKVQNDFTV